jgi:hypothetical protein
MKEHNQKLALTVLFSFIYGDLSDYKTNRRRAFRSKVMLWVQSTGQPGKASIQAKADNIKSEHLEIEVN